LQPIGFPLICALFGLLLYGLEVLLQIAKRKRLVYDRLQKHNHLVIGYRRQKIMK